MQNNSIITSQEFTRLLQNVEEGIVKAANGVNFDLANHERMGLVGESGCGKSTMALGLMRLIKEPGEVVAGEAWLDGEDLFSLNYEEMRQARALKIGMIPQGAMNSLVPVIRVKKQIYRRYD